MNAPIGIGVPRAVKVLAACLSLGLGCGGQGDSSGTGADGGGGPDGANPNDGSMQNDGGGSSSGGGDGASSCVPTIPQVPWKSPYAGWPRGIPTDPSFFPIAVWLQGSWHATELAQLGVNIYVGNNAGVDTLAMADLATLKAQGLYAIIGQDSVGLANIADPTIVGWWMDPDEPDNAQPNGQGGYGPPVDPATLVTQYDKYKAADPTRPIWLGLGQGVAFDAWEGRGNNAPPEMNYVPASDIVGFDIYPYNNCGGDSNEQMTCGQFWLNATGVDRLHQWSNRGQAVWTDFETTVISANSTAGPTTKQVASEVWLSLVHEANGILYFIDSWNPSFREDAIFASQPMTAAVTALNAQIKSLAPELNSATIPNLVTVTSSNTAAPVDTMVKANGKSLYVFSAVSRKGSTMASYAITGMTGNAVAKVVGENRTVDVKAGKFSDAFADNDVHIYVVDLSTATCN
jgi:hypothetical protein